MPRRSERGDREGSEDRGWLRGGERDAAGGHGAGGEVLCEELHCGLEEPPAGRSGAGERVLGRGRGVQEGGATRGVYDLSE